MMNFTLENGCTLQVVGVGENRIGTLPSIIQRCLAKVTKSRNRSFSPSSRSSICAVRCGLGARYDKNYVASVRRAMDDLLIVTLSPAIAGSWRCATLQNVHSAWAICKQIHILLPFSSTDWFQRKPLQISCSLEIRADWRIRPCRRVTPSPRSRDQFRSARG
jgi:hypothetical protein